MVSILFRTLLIYFSLIIIMRLMGKRQIGELEVTDLVTTLLISEIASLPITDRDIPVFHALIPMVLLLALEIFSSVILIRCPRLKSLVSAKPTVIIENGQIRQSALCDLRISIEELMGEIRQQGYLSLTQISCAILEKNGKLTVFPFSEFSPPTAGDLQVFSQQPELMHVLYCGGCVNKAGLAMIGKDRAWLESEAKTRGFALSDLFCATGDRAGKLCLIPKEQKEEIH